MDTKTLKISEVIHKELKIFIAKSDDMTITEFADLAIARELKAKGHKLPWVQFPPKSKKHKK